MSDIDKKISEISKKLVNLSKFEKDNNAQVAKPRFCPEGCGETLEVTALEGEELEIVSKQMPFKNNWKIRCTVCKLEKYLSEGM